MKVLKDLLVDRRDLMNPLTSFLKRLYTKTCDYKIINILTSLIVIITPSPLSSSSGTHHYHRHQEKDFVITGQPKKNTFDLLPPLLWIWHYPRTFLDIFRLAQGTTLLRFTDLNHKKKQLSSQAVIAVITNWISMLKFGVVWSMKSSAVVGIISIQFTRGAAPEKSLWNRNLITLKSIQYYRQDVQTI